MSGEGVSEKTHVLCFDGPGASVWFLASFKHSGAYVATDDRKGAKLFTERRANNLAEALSPVFCNRGGWRVERAQQ